MDPIAQWGIILIVNILTFFAGRAFERYKTAQVNRLKLLEPIEQWVDKATRLVSIVEDEFSIMNQGLPLYNPIDIGETAKFLRENKEKILGILQSKALSTRGTKKLSEKLFELIIQIQICLEREYLPAYYNLSSKIDKHENPSLELSVFLSMTIMEKNLIKDVHSCLSELKTKYN